MPTSSRACRPAPAASCSRTPDRPSSCTASAWSPNTGSRSLPNENARSCRSWVRACATTRSAPPSSSARPPPAPTSATPWGNSVPGTARNWSSSPTRPDWSLRSDRDEAGRSWASARVAVCGPGPRPTMDAGGRLLLDRGGGRARRAGAEHLELVLHVGEAVLGGHLRRPAFDRRVGHLDGAPARAAHQVVVVHRRAAPVGGLALVPEHVDQAVVHQGLQRPVDRREADGVAALAQQGVQVLSGAEALLVVEQGQDGAALPGLAAGSLAHAASSVALVGVMTDGAVLVRDLASSVA